MAHDEFAASGAPTKLVIRNIGLMLSGDIANPILDADAIVAIDGRITAIGRGKDVDAEGAATIVDANGVCVAPGLIDSHVHPVAGDWTPRQNQYRAPPGQKTAGPSSQWSLSPETRRHGLGTAITAWFVTQ